MSYLPIPKNAAKKAAVSVRGKANYYQASTVAKPTPSAAELATGELITLAETDTHNEYYWNTVEWVLYIYRGALNIHDADTHIVPVNHFAYFEGATYTLSVAIASQSTSLALTAVAGLAVGDRLHLTDTATGAHDHDLLRITAIVGNVVTVNRPIDFDYAIATTTVQRVVVNMNVAGTLAAPISYVLKVTPGEVWHLTALDFNITDNAAMDDSLFGALAALTNGVVIRQVDVTNGTYQTFSVWKDNSSFIKDSFGVQYSTKAPAGSEGVRGTLNFHNVYGAIVRIANTSIEEMYVEILIQDNLSAITTFEIKFHGHIEAR